MTPTTFARELAARLAASVPDGFTVSAEGQTIAVDGPGAAGATTSLAIDADEADDPDAYADAAEGVLSLVQDVVSEALDATWPSSGETAFDLPIPGVRIDQGVMHLWYGDDDAPVLALPALQL